MIQLNCCWVGAVSNPYKTILTFVSHALGNVMTQRKPAVHGLNAIAIRSRHLPAENTCVRGSLPGCKNSAAHHPGSRRLQRRQIVLTTSDPAACIKTVTLRASDVLALGLGALTGDVGFPKIGKLPFTGQGSSLMRKLSLQLGQQAPEERWQLRRWGLSKNSKSTALLNRTARNLYVRRCLSTRLAPISRNRSNDARSILAAFRRIAAGGRPAQDVAVA